MNAPQEPVEAYLDRLFDLLSGSGSAGRRFLAEVEEHLRESVESGLARGLTRERAEDDAVARFGPVEQVAAGFAAVSRRWSLRQLFGAGAVVGAVGMLALGLSGLISELVGDFLSRAFVAGDPPGITYTAARCADYLRLSPGSGSCSAAALEDHFGEVVMPRIAAGVLGLIVLAVLAYLRGRPDAHTWLPSRRLVGLVGGVAAGLCAAVFLLDGGLLLVHTGTDHGAGAALADGAMAGLAALGFAVVLVRDQLSRGRLTSPVR